MIKQDFKTSIEELKPVDSKFSLSLLQKHFNSEKDFCNYLELNIDIFCEQCLNVVYKSHIREQRIEPFTFRKRIHKRIDFLVQSACGKTILIECKNPKEISENGAALGQILHYTSLFTKWRKEPDLVVLLTTKFDPELVSTISKYSLPILYIAMDKDNYLFSSISHFEQ